MALPRTTTSATITQRGRSGFGYGALSESGVRLAMSSSIFSDGDHVSCYSDTESVGYKHTMRGSLAVECVCDAGGRVEREQEWLCDQ